MQMHGFPSLEERERCVAHLDLSQDSADAPDCPAYCPASKYNQEKGRIVWRYHVWCTKLKENMPDSSWGQYDSWDSSASTCQAYKFKIFNLQYVLQKSVVIHMAQSVNAVVGVVVLFLFFFLRPILLDSDGKPENQKMAFSKLRILD